MLGAMNLLTVSMPALAHNGADQKMEKINVASIRAIEGAWLRVPKSCKARGFHASPVALESNQASVQIQSIYALYGV